ncbi:MAG: phage/plasmid primase, P4 family [Planctomycetota bacterium]
MELVELLRRWERVGEMVTWEREWRFGTQSECELRRHDIDDSITKLSKVQYDPKADCPTWREFLDRIMAGNSELIAYLRRLVGYCLTGCTTEQVLPLLYGTGANGKSVFLNTVQALQGRDYAIKAAPDLLLAKKGAHPTELADLHGKRFVACIESDDGRRLAESLVKELTGGDSIRARRMREDFWEFAPTHKIWLATNHKSTVRGTDHGIWHRVKLIPFTVTIPDDEQDKELPNKLLAELPGILTWALLGRVFVFWCLFVCFGSEPQFTLPVPRAASMVRPTHDPKRADGHRAHSHILRIKLENMPMSKHGRYPSHLAKLVSQRLLAKDLVPPSDEVLLRLFETLYFASLRTEEGRPCRCTINYVAPDIPVAREADPARHANHWTTVPFDHALPFDVRSLAKLAEAVDPSTASLAVYSDGEKLFIWGLVDQELRYADFVASDTTTVPERAGLFQATITGVGNLCVYDNYALLASLEQNNLVDEYHDVVWSGPLHEVLKQNLQAALADDPKARVATADVAQIEKELLVRWNNAVCRVLMNIQQYRHGGGLLIVPSFPASHLNIKYNLTYDRLPQALFGLVQHQLLKRQSTETIARHCKNQEGDTLPCDFHFDAVSYQKKLDEHRAEALGCVRFISSLSRVDGFVVADQRLVVHGFGVELRADSHLTDIYIAGDSLATETLLRKGTLSQFGTRHRAMLRYCNEHPNSLGFVISQDGDIRATMRHGDRLILWENINVQLAFRSENRRVKISNLTPMMGLLQSWVESVTGIAAES